LMTTDDDDYQKVRFLTTDDDFKKNLKYFFQKWLRIENLCIPLAC
jgi:hypothetical protein